eukprot:INCI3582.1.p1 GENE.INCI3582.1~~INCI3582.1.p1  ORF type:complete len:178 (+),score=36.44 INCI3582.1:252-785(+)
MSFEDEESQVVLNPSASLDDDYADDVDLDIEGGGSAGGARASRKSGSSSGGGGGDDLDFSDAFLDLRRSYMNEKLAPELLPFNEELVDTIKATLANQQDQIDEMEPADVGEGVMLSLLRMENDRIDFMLKSYLRARLQKIERYILHYTHTPEMRDRLSSQEKVRGGRGEEEEYCRFG